MARNAWAGVLLQAEAEVARGGAGGGREAGCLSASLGLAEAHHMRAVALQEAARQASSAEEEASLRNEGISECRGAHSRYEQALSLGAGPDARADGASALTTWAELTSRLEERLQLLDRAKQEYIACLESQAEASGSQANGPTPETDVDLLMNLGEALLHRAECLHDMRLDRGADPRNVDEGDVDAAYDWAFKMYDEACSNADSRRGDDLSGLLFNWGICLLSAGQRAGSREKAGEFFAQAQAKFEGATQFSAGSYEPVLGLGDTLMAQADLWAAAGDHTRAWTCTQDALKRGFEATLGIDRYNVDATIGVAEAHSALGKIALVPGANPGAAQEHFSQSMQAYQAVLEEPKLRRAIGGFREVADVQYNCACAAAQAGHMTAAQQLLAPLFAYKLADRADALQDADLLALHPWLQQAGP